MSSAFVNAKGKCREESDKMPCLKTANGSQESATEMNTSYLHASHCSSMSSESDLSFSLSIDRELDAFASRIIAADELPAFEIRLISPLGRTPSPIDSDMAGQADDDTPTKWTTERFTPSPHHNNPDFVALQDINAQISPPSDNEDPISRSNSLETIFEGVFLSTPPRIRHSNSRSNILEKVALNRLHTGKENSPLSRETPPRRTGPLYANIQGTTTPNKDNHFGLKKDLYNQ